MSCRFDRASRVQSTCCGRPIKVGTAQRLVGTERTVVGDQIEFQVTGVGRGAESGQSAKCKVVSAISWRRKSTRCQIHRSTNIKLFHLKHDDASVTL